jgi:hypothetical protein
VDGSFSIAARPGIAGGAAWTPVAAATRCAANTPGNALRVELVRDIVSGPSGPMVNQTVVGNHHTTRSCSLRPSSPASSQTRMRALLAVWVQVSRRISGHGEHGDELGERQLRWRQGCWQMVSVCRRCVSLSHSARSCIASASGRRRRITFLGQNSGTKALRIVARVGAMEGRLCRCTRNNCTDVLAYCVSVLRTARRSGVRVKLRPWDIHGRAVLGSSCSIEGPDEHVPMWTTLWINIRHQGFANFVQTFITTGQFLRRRRFCTKIGNSL